MPSITPSELDTVDKLFSDYMGGVKLLTVQRVKLSDNFICTFRAEKPYNYRNQFGNWDRTSLLRFEGETIRECYEAAVAELMTARMADL